MQREKARGATIDRAYLVQIGNRLRASRMQRGISQSALGKLLDVTFQQVQKYEKGTNQMPISSIRQAASGLDTTVSYLLGLDAEQAAASKRQLAIERIDSVPHGQAALDTLWKLTIVPDHGREFARLCRIIAAFIQE